MRFGLAIDLEAYQLTTWGSQWVAYVSFYNAYEAFLVNA